MGFDELIARMDGNTVDVNAQIDLKNMSNWDIAILIGKTVSLYLHGYEDNFDAIDWTDAAREIKPDGITTRTKIIKILIDEMGYDLKDYC